MSVVRSDRDDKKPEGQSKAELWNWRGTLARIAVCVEEMSKLKRRRLIDRVNRDDKASELESP